MNRYQRTLKETYLIITTIVCWHLYSTLLLLYNDCNSVEFRWENLMDIVRLLTNVIDFQS